VVYRDVTRQAKGLYRLKHVRALRNGLTYLSRYNSGWFCHTILPSKYSDQYDAVYKDLPKKQQTLKKAKNCEFCNAKRFPGEGPAFCCRKGNVNIYILELPARLRRLFASQTEKDTKYFWKHIRYFNLHFSFTSFGVSIDHHLASA
jgi:hypothetical protein